MRAAARRALHGDQLPSQAKASSPRLCGCRLGHICGSSGVGLDRPAGSQQWRLSTGQWCPSAGDAGWSHRACNNVVVAHVRPDQKLDSSQSVFDLSSGVITALADRPAVCSLQPTLHVYAVRRANYSMMCRGLTAVRGCAQVHPFHEVPGRLVHVVPDIGAAVTEHPRHSHQGIQRQVSSRPAWKQTFMAP